MWVRKTEDEIRQDRSKGKNDLLGPGVISLVFFIGVIFSMKTGFFEGESWETIPKSWEEVFEDLPMIVAVSLSLGVFAWLLQRFLLGKGIRFCDFQKALICQKCGKTKTDDGISDCSCGGRYVDIDTVKWIDP